MNARPYDCGRLKSTQWYVRLHFLADDVDVLDTSERQFLDSVNIGPECGDCLRSILPFFVERSAHK